MGLAMQCNINNTDRINRGIIGAFIAITACLNFSKTFYFTLGMVLVLQAAIGVVLDDYWQKKHDKARGPAHNPLSTYAYFY